MTQTNPPTANPEDPRPRPEALIASLASALPGMPLSTEPQAIAQACTDWRGRYHSHALAMAKPSSAAELATVVQLCAQHQVAICTQGGNTGLVGGSVPCAEQHFDLRPQLLLQTTGLRETLQIDPSNLSITASAGFTLHEVQSCAAEQGLLFPLSLASEGSCTVGGNLATNAGGTAALRYGTMRDLCLSLEYVNAQGQLCGSLHGLRKNNMGYDLRHLLIGSEGTLGIITTACLKLFPAPRSRCTAWLHVDHIHAAVAALQALQGRLYGLLSTYEWMNHAAVALVEEHTGLKAPPSPMACDHVLLECTALCTEAELQDTVTQALAEVLEQTPGVRNAVIAQNLSEADTLWALRERIPEAQARQGLNIKHDVAFEASKLGAFHDAALAALSSSGIEVEPILFGHLGDGNLHFNLAAPAGCDAQAFLQTHEARIHKLVYGCVQAHGGTPSAEHGIGQLKRELLQSHLSASTYQQLRAIKAALDPHHLLNPGKMLG